MNIELRSYEQSTMILGAIHIIIMCTQNPKMLTPPPHTHTHTQYAFCIGKIVLFIKSVCFGETPLHLVRTYYVNDPLDFFNFVICKNGYTLFYVSNWL